MKFVVKRSAWNKTINSNGSRSSLVSNNENNDIESRSIFGYLGKECGISDEEMKRVTYPSLLYSRYENNQWPKSILVDIFCIPCMSETTAQIIRLEINLIISSFEQENRLTDLFSQLNIEVQFIV